ncbi:LPXTG-motif cell wall anchor domain protein [Bifidobacterium gallicum DSM 20093 = LMG 11596]|uniref:LPXTG-motif cell wall anchor domain protein n=2 Tax=Bifidobacterium gallicum DSM 20093 = LMG 11596 TaxID=561180 RepID=D1NS24_9BIFI|nr:LPXTG-motif cell wall anchor domain protein [Bifidobacterium gallicum DSM 20093 = LMG 11596]
MAKLAMALLLTLTIMTGLPKPAAAVPASTGPSRDATTSNDTAPNRNATPECQPAGGADGNDPNATYVTTRTFTQDCGKPTMAYALSHIGIVTQADLDMHTPQMIGEMLVGGDVLQYGSRQGALTWGNGRWRNLVPSYIRGNADVIGNGNLNLSDSQQPDTPVTGVLPIYLGTTNAAHWMTSQSDFGHRTSVRRYTQLRFTDTYADIDAIIADAATQTTALAARASIHIDTQPDASSWTGWRFAITGADSAHCSVSNVVMIACEPGFTIALTNRAATNMTQGLRIDLRGYQIHTEEVQQGSDRFLSVPETTIVTNDEGSAEHPVVMPFLLFDTLDAPQGIQPANIDDNSPDRPHRPQILFAYPNATEVHAMGDTYGFVVAPHAHVIVGQGSYGQTANGAFIAHSLQLATPLHEFLRDATTVQPQPDPTTPPSNPDTPPTTPDTPVGHYGHVPLRLVVDDPQGHANADEDYAFDLQEVDVGTDGQGEPVVDEASRYTHVQPKKDAPIQTHHISQRTWDTTICTMLNDEAYAQEGTHYYRLTQRMPQSAAYTSDMPEQGLVLRVNVARDEQGYHPQLQSLTAQSGQLPAHTWDFATDAGPGVQVHVRYPADTPTPQPHDDATGPRLPDTGGPGWDGAWGGVLVALGVTGLLMCWRKRQHE